MPELPSPNLQIPAPLMVDERFELLVEGIRDYAIIMLDPSGRIAHWNCGARRTFGYETAEVVGRTTHLLYSTADARLGLPDAELELLRQQGHCQEEGWRI